MPDVPESKPAPRKQRRREPRFAALAQIRAFNKADRVRIIRELRSSVPGLGASFGIHLLILIPLALIIIRQQSERLLPIELGWSTRVDTQGAEAAQQATVELPIVSLSNNPPTTVPRVERTADVPQPGTSPAEQDQNPGLKLGDVSNSLSRRLHPDQRPVDADGGPREGAGREAIQKALRWIVRQQQSDGSWSLNRPYADAGSIQTDTGATALALLALLGDGQTHVSGDYKDAVRQGLVWLQRAQRPNGDLFDSLEEGKEPHFYAHAQGTIALCEALALTGDETLRDPAEQAVRFLIEAQNPELGGWKYRPLTASGIGDLSVTGWVLMALHTARMANIEVPFETFILAERFLDAVQELPSNRALYKYRPDQEAEESQRWSMTAEGLLCRQWLGWPKHDPAMRRGADFLLAEKNRPEWKEHRRNVYAWYYTAQMLHNLGGPEWEQWYAEAKTLIVKNQQSAGKDQGSWHPTRPTGAFHERSRDAGRLYLTVMCVLILQTPDRHLSVYESLSDEG